MESEKDLKWEEVDNGGHHTLWKPVAAALTWVAPEVWA